MGWGFVQWKWEWTCKHCKCKGNPYSKEKCKRCKAAWWTKPEVNPQDNKGEVVPSKWDAGYPAWMKGEKPPGQNGTKKAPPVESTLEESITSIQNVLEMLGEEEEVVKGGLQKKLETLQKQKPKELEDKEMAAQLEEHKKHLQKLDAAIAQLQGVPGCQENLQQLQDSKAALEQTIKEKSKKPAEERLRSLQDKKNHRSKLLQDLSKDIKDKEESLMELKEKEREQTKELQQINKELKQVMTEVTNEQDVNSLEDPTAICGGIAPSLGGAAICPETGSGAIPNQQWKKDPLGQSTTQGEESPPSKKDEPMEDIVSDHGGEEEMVRESALPKERRQRQGPY